MSNQKRIKASTCKICCEQETFEGDLCGDCYDGIETFQFDPQLLRDAADYIDRYINDNMKRRTR